MITIFPTLMIAFDQQQSERNGTLWHFMEKNNLVTLLASYLKYDNCEGCHDCRDVVIPTCYNQSYDKEPLNLLAFC